MFIALNNNLRNVDIFPSIFKNKFLVGIETGYNKSLGLFDNNGRIR